MTIDTTQLNTITTIADEAIAWIGDQVLLSQGHCVNVLLDMYTATDDVGLRWSIAERLDEIRFLSMVEAKELRADIDAIVEIATSPEAADLEWARAALEQCGATEDSTIAA
jgi:hypothetical protein